LFYIGTFFLSFWLGRGDTNIPFIPVLGYTFYICWLDIDAYLEVYVYVYVYV